MALVSTETEVEAIGKTVKTFSLQGEVAVAWTPLYECPAGRIASVKLIFYGAVTSNNLDIRGYDPFLDRSIGLQFDLPYNVSDYTNQIKGESSNIHRDASDSFLYKNSSSIFRNKIIIAEGQEFQYKIDNTNKWKLVYEITEEDA